MSSTEEKRENGLVMTVIGWVMVLFGFMVFYFHPAAIKLGEMRFAVIAGTLAGAGAVLVVLGRWIRRRNN
jgi:hypothetical protein